MKNVLIANRGEIAVRIQRACHDEGLRTVAVYADQDMQALHVRCADQAYALNGRSAADTYLNTVKLVQIAHESDADAVHPGYGFLSENADFAQAVLDAGLLWIGPSPATIRLLGDKVSARALAREVGAPLTPGSDGPVRDAEEVIAFVKEHGLPVAIKAAHGGGGRGMKVVRKLEDIPEALAAAQREAVLAFGRGECFVERFLDRPRHVEAQVIADQFGRVVVLGTRDCSLQRRNQKLVEEAPAPFLSTAQEEEIHRAAADICRAADYQGAGTVEFLLGADGFLSFLEVNTRLQVEHPVTEESYRVDLVAEQLRIARGEPLSVAEAPLPQGHSIEFRINAEDPGRGFLPSAGSIQVFEPPCGLGLRVDTGVRSGDTVPAEFDSLLAKLIVHGATREQALSRARQALAEFRILGVATVLPFHQAVVEHPDFSGGHEGFGVHTTWIESEFLLPEPNPEYRHEPSPGRLRLRIDLDGKAMTLGVPQELLHGLGSGITNGQAASAPEAETSDPGLLTAPLAGTLLKWLAPSGATVTQGEAVAILEAMKMEVPVLAPHSGRLEITVTEPGTEVTSGQELGHISSR